MPDCYKQKASYKYRKVCSMIRKCRCGSPRFRPLGVQNSWPGRGGTASPPVLYLATCRDCGTTVTLGPLQYALLRNSEMEAALDFSFFTGDQVLAA
ncbi:MAG: hypothetical protein FJY67_07365 [Calditrichaeota bacterium]|nr:hypothetical protein [Calditrichota bacterium]